MWNTCPTLLAVILHIGLSGHVTQECVSIDISNFVPYIRCVWNNQKADLHGPKIRSASWRASRKRQKSMTHEQMKNKNEEHRLVTTSLHKRQNRSIFILNTKRKRKSIHSNLYPKKKQNTHPLFRDIIQLTTSPASREKVHAEMWIQSSQCHVEWHKTSVHHLRIHRMWASFLIRSYQPNVLDSQLFAICDASHVALPHFFEHSTTPFSFTYSHHSDEKLGKNRLKPRLFKMIPRCFKPNKSVYHLDAISIETFLSIFKRFKHKIQKKMSAKSKPIARLLHSNMIRWLLAECFLFLSPFAGKHAVLATHTSITEIAYIYTWARRHIKAERFCAETRDFISWALAWKGRRPHLVREVCLFKKNKTKRGVCR